MKTKIATLILALASCAPERVSDTTVEAADDTSTGACDGLDVTTEHPSDECPDGVCECTEVIPYRLCDPECAIGCAEGMECMGPIGSCLAECTEAADCPPTAFPSPWDQPVCLAGVCGVPCGPDGKCPNASIFSCQGGVCLPY